MEIKKNKSADLEEGRVTRLLIALVFILSSILVALEYNTGGGDDANLDEEMLDDVEREIEMMPVTQQENRIALAPKKKQEATPQKIRVVDEEVAPANEELNKADGDTKGEDLTTKPGTPQPATALSIGSKPIISSPNMSASATTKPTTWLRESELAKTPIAVAAPASRKLPR